MGFKLFNTSSASGLIFNPSLISGWLIIDGILSFNIFPDSAPIIIAERSSVTEKQSPPSKSCLPLIKNPRIGNSKDSLLQFNTFPSVLIVKTGYCNSFIHKIPVIASLC